MTDPKGIRFKDRTWVLAWLDTALEKEKEKYAKCPVIPDMVPGHEAAQGWGYVVAGYALVEQSFKALLHLREKNVPARHSLSNLFGLWIRAIRQSFASTTPTTGLRPIVV